MTSSSRKWFATWSLLQITHLYREGVSKIEIEVGYIIWIQLYATTEWIEECIAFVIMRFRNSRHQIPMLLLLWLECLNFVTFCHDIYCHSKHSFSFHIRVKSNQAWFSNIYVQHKLAKCHMLITSII